MDIHSNLLIDIPCIVLCGNDEIFLETYVRIMIKQYYKLDSPIILKDHTENEITYKTSSYHFEMNYTTAHNLIIKNIIRNQNISGRKFIFVLNKFTNNQRQYQLKTLLDSPNAIFIIIAKSINNLDPGITSRATILHKPFKYEHTKEFLKRHYDIDEYDRTMGIISNIAKITLPKYARDLSLLLDVIMKSRNQMDIVSGIKDYCYKTFHICIPLSAICKLVIKKYIKHVKLAEIVELCAQCDHSMSISTRDILCYEQLFTGLWNILRG